MTNNIIPFPAAAPDKAEYFRQLPEAARAMAEISYWDGQIERLYEVCRPYEKGWVASKEACFHRRTKADYVKMFQIFKGEPAYDLLGFRDEAEGMICESAAIEVGSNWRFNDFYIWKKSHGMNGLGNLNDALAEYADAFIPGLFPDEIPTPPTREAEETHDQS